MTASQANVKPRLHPIGEPADLFQIRAIGFLKGVIAPDGAITLTGGFHGKALTLGSEVYGLVQKILKKGVNEAMFVVWPRTKNGSLNSFQVIGVWKPSILDPNSGAQDYLPEGENYFSIRGEVCKRVWCDDNYGRNVSVKVFGDHFVTVDFAKAPYLSIGDFVSLNAFLTEDGRLYTEQVNRISVPEAAVSRGHKVVRKRSSATA